MIVPPRIQEAARHAEAALAEAREGSQREWARTLVHHALVGLLAVGLIGGAIFFLRSPEALPAAPALTDACNGDVSLCARRLDEVVFAGAHNSMSAAELDGWMFPNQELASVSLLGHGIRALLFDVHYGAPLGDRVRTDIDDEAASRAKFEKVIGKEAVDAAMRIRARMQGAPTGPRAAYLCHGFCELGATPLVDDARRRAPVPRLQPGRGARVRDRGLRHAGRHRRGVSRERARALRVPRRAEAAVADAARADRLRPADPRARRERHRRRRPGTTRSSRSRRRRPTSSSPRRSSPASRTAAGRAGRCSRSTTGSRRCPPRSRRTRRS